MKRKIKTILLSMLCAACRQAPLYVGAVDLPFVPVEESQAESTAAVSETSAVTEKPAEQETTVMTAAKTTKQRSHQQVKRMQLPTRAVSESTALENRDSKTKELPVLSPDGEETNESSNDTQPTTTDTKKSSFHKAIAVIFCVAAVAGAIVYAIFRKRNQR